MHSVASSGHCCVNGVGRTFYLPFEGVVVHISRHSALVSKLLAIAKNMHHLRDYSGAASPFPESPTAGPTIRASHLVLRVGQQAIDGLLMEKGVLPFD